VTPGFRTHLGRDWYLLGAVEIPMVNPTPFDYQVSGALLCVQYRVRRAVVKAKIENLALFTRMQLH
jgi:hypothetical protein